MKMKIRANAVVAVCAASLSGGGTSIMGEGGMLPPFQENLERCQDYAGFWKRALAFIIDTLIFLLFGWACLAAGFFGIKSEEGKELIVVILFVIVNLSSFPYYVLFECSRFQATPGKLALGLRVTDLSGKRLSLGHAVRRELARFYCAFITMGYFTPFIYFPAAFTERKQGLHDLLAQTLVLNGRARDVRAR